MERYNNIMICTLLILGLIALYWIYRLTAKK